MSKEFLSCVKNGGKVKTIDVGKDSYLHVCFLGGKHYKGEVLKKKNHGKGTNKFSGALANKNPELSSKAVMKLGMKMYGQ